MLRKAYFFICLISLLGSISSYGQYDIKTKERSFGIRDGLASRWTHCITEDNNKLLWIGTAKGISRYDGNQFINLNSSNSNLRSNLIEKILRDTLGNLWVFDLQNANKSTLNLHDHYHPVLIDIVNPLTLEIESFDQFFHNAPFREKDIKTIREVNSGIWIETYEQGFYLYDGQFKQLIHQSVAATYDIITPMDETNFWAITNEKIQLINTSNLVKNTDYFPTQQEIIEVQTIDQSLWTISVSSDREYIYIHKISVSQGIKQILKVKSYPIIGNFPLNTLVCPFQVIPISEKEFRIRIFNNSLNVKLNKSNNTTSVNPHKFSTHHWFKDSYQNLWHTEEEGGVKLINRKLNYFDAQLNESDERIATRAIYEQNDGSIIVGTNNGLVQIDTNREIVIINKASIVSDIIKIEPDKWFLTGYKQGLSKFSNHNPNNITITSLAPNYNVNTTVVIKSDVPSMLWVGSNNGLLRYDIINETLDADFPINKDSVFSKSEITDLYLNKSGLWVASYSGLFLVNPDSAIIRAYHNETGFPFNRIQHIYDDGTYFWLATNGNGLIKWDPSSEEYLTFTTADNMSNDYIHATYEDQEGYLWLPSDNGLMRMNKSTNDISIFTTNDGLTTNEFNRYSHLQDRKGNLHFGSIDGLISFQPEAINKSIQHQHHLSFTSINTSNSKNNSIESHLKQYKNNNSITVKPSDTNLNLKFSLTDFSHDNKYQYAYWIEGLDITPKYITNNNLELGRLPYGDFTLRIKGRSYGSPWSSNVLALSIQVQLPFHKTWIFTCAMVLFTIGLIYMGVQYRLSILQKNNQRLQAEVNARTAELQDVNKSKDKLFAVLAHDLRGPISSFKNLSKKVQYLISKGEWDKLDAMTTQIHNDTTRLDQLISNLVPWVLVQSKNPELIKTNFDLSEVLDEILKELDNNIGNKNISIINKVKPKTAVIADRTALEIIIRNILTNAIKYSHKDNSIQIINTSNNNYITLLIKDAGIGMSQEQLSEIFSAYASSRGTAGEQGHGLGLTLARDLAVRNGGSLSLESTEGVGTTASLKLPAS